MSRTRTDKEQAGKGLVRESHRRQQGQSWTRIRIGPEAENPGQLIDTYFAGARFGRDRVKFIADQARDWLEAQGLQNTPGVFYKRGDPLVAVSREEYDREKGGIDALDKFLEKLGYGFWDDERMMARIIGHADRILDPGPKVDVIEEAYQIGNLFEKLRYFQAADARTGKQRKRKSLRPAIGEVLEEEGLNASAKSVWGILKEKGMVWEDDSGNAAWAEGEIKWKTFENAVSRERKRLKNPGK